MARPETERVATRHADATATFCVTVLYSPAPRQVRQWRFDCAPGTTVLQAVSATVFDAFPDLRAGRPMVGIWGKKTGLHHVLQGGDRLEVYRGLLVDPKVARRERFRQQGARSAGLFAKRRAGAKAGY